MGKLNLLMFLIIIILTIIVKSVNTNVHIFNQSNETLPNELLNYVANITHRAFQVASTNTNTSNNINQ